MAEPKETDDLELENESEDEDESDAGSDGSDGESGSEGTPPVDKRISELQSKADKAEARANKLEKLLSGRDDGGDGKDGKDPERAVLMTELREASLDAVYGEFEALKEYGIDRTLVEGTTRAEMRESATSLVGLIKNVETKARNKALREHGIKAEPAGATRQPPKNFASMSDEDFEKELARAKSGGSSLSWS